MKTNAISPPLDGAALAINKDTMLWTKRGVIVAAVMGTAAFVVPLFSTKHDALEPTPHSSVNTGVIAGSTVNGPVTVTTVNMPMAAAVSTDSSSKNAPGHNPKAPSPSKRVSDTLALKEYFLRNYELRTWTSIPGPYAIRIAGPLTAEKVNVFFQPVPGPLVLGNGEVVQVDFSEDPACFVISQNKQRIAGLFTGVTRQAC